MYDNDDSTSHLDVGESELHKPINYTKIPDATFLSRKGILVGHSSGYSMEDLFSLNV